MAVVVVVDEERSRFGWLNAFRVLAIERCRPLFAELGVPTSMAASPARLAQLAHGLLEAGLGSWRGVSYPQGALTLLTSQTFAALSAEYSEQDTEVLYNWIKRHFVDNEQRDIWWTWKILLRHAASLLSARDRQFDSLPSAIIANDRIKRAILNRFGPTARTRDDQLITNAQQVSPTPFEERVLELEITSERRSRYPTTIDLIRMLKRVMTDERAYQVWTEIDLSLTEPEQEAIVKWGREQAIGISVISPEWVRLPVRR